MADGKCEACGQQVVVGANECPRCRAGLPVAPSEAPTSGRWVGEPVTRVNVPGRLPEGVSPLDAADPASVGPYRLLGRLGVGGMGVVFLGQNDAGQRAAVKVVRSELASQAQFRVRFAREVKAADSVSGTFTAQVLDSDTESRTQWVATAYVPGLTVAEYVETHGAIRGDGARVFGLGLAEALHTIHVRGLVHRDVKPSNVIMGVDGPKVIDFGISHAIDATSLTQTGTHIGSLAWMAPEQMTGDAVGPATDVFAWGLVVAYAALGRHPYGEGRPEALAFRMANQEPDLTGLAGPLSGAVAGALNSNPDERPSTLRLFDALSGPKNEYSAGIASSLATGPVTPSQVATVVAAPHPAPTGQAPLTAASPPPLANGGPARVPPVASPTPRKNRKVVALVSSVAAIALVGGTVVTAVALLPKDEAGTLSAAPAPSTVPQDSPSPQESGYPIIGDQPLTVREAPYLAAAEVGSVAPGDRVTVQCTTVGDPVRESSGVENTQWNYINGPVTGFVPDRYVDSGGVLAPQPECSRDLIPSTDWAPTSAAAPSVGGLRLGMSAAEAEATGEAYFDPTRNGGNLPGSLVSTSANGPDFICSGGGEAIGSFNFQRPVWSTPEGIGVGSSSWEVFQAYPDASPVREQPSVLLVVREGWGYVFRTADGTVESVTLMSDVSEDRAIYGDCF